MYQGMNRAMRRRLMFGTKKHNNRKATRGRIIQREFDKDGNEKFIVHAR